jgi:hypothetical protein
VPKAYNQQRRSVATMSPRGSKFQSSMEREYWTEALTEAEQELEAAPTRSGLNAAAKKLMRPGSGRRCAVARSRG